MMLMSEAGAAVQADPLDIGAGPSSQLSGRGRGRPVPRVNQDGLVLMR